ncbi:hypothetical protein [Rhizorhapis sp.]|uniref:hypothetical protein n=1 Tax=Rhizorhapis sp. TaxID=1968842 RepID=UPI002B47E495|nr:hypothetical protein [Rhizorhapis sp.]HKR16179.1 hypothetical protein [Rhizorhapis sp.]
MRPLLCLMSLALLATSATAVAGSKKPDNLVPSGKAVTCVQLRQIRNTEVRNDRTIDFHMLGGKIYRNTLPHSCPGLGFEERFMYKTSLSQLCNVDIITVLYSRGSGLDRGASCGLGKFQPMAKTPSRG